MTASAGLSTGLTMDDPTLRRPVAPPLPAVPRPAVLHMVSESPPASPAVLEQPQVSCVPVSTRRGRRTHLVTAAVVTLAVIGGLGWLGQAAGARTPAETAVVRVGAGETVWDVAQRVAPASDPRAVVERIRQLNGLVGSAVQPGQQLRVPTGR
ncbi:MAG: LysM peptidoglycan-binding domain-containing protein [Pseudonocardiaceae bacterium]